MTAEEVLGKFRSNAKSTISAKHSEELITAVQNLEKVNNVGIIVDLLKSA